MTMIERIKGKIIEKTPTKVVVDVNGVGYGLNVSLNTSSAIGEEGSEESFYTYHHVREDVQALYGFAREIERELFLLLLSVSKIGPKTALGALSGMTVENFVHAVSSGNAGLLTKIPGIGRQTSERIIVELKGKMAKFESAVLAGTGAEGAAPLSGKRASEAVLALESLGYKRFFAEKAVAKVVEEKGSDLPVEELIKAALKYV
jgi:Holliday junction DNA helicase RuvA